MVLQEAAKHPLSTETLAAQFGRLGETLFELGSIDNQLEGHCHLAVSELNRLRRSLVDQLPEPELPAPIGPRNDRSYRDLLPLPYPQSFSAEATNERPPILFGRSTHSLAQAEAALAEGFDYIGFGPLFPTPTTAGRPGIGLAEVAEMERRVGSRIPAFCIGGIKRSNLNEVLAAGARRVVMVSDLLSAPDIEAATRMAKAGIRPPGGSVSS